MISDYHKINKTIKQNTQYAKDITKGLRPLLFGLLVTKDEGNTLLQNYGFSIRHSVTSQKI